MFLHSKRRDRNLTVVVNSAVDKGCGSDNVPTNYNGVCLRLFSPDEQFCWNKVLLEGEEGCGLEK